MESRIVVVGLGNAYMKDDGLGVRVADALKQRELGRHISVQTHSEMDLTIAQELQGASKLVVVDALRSGRKPGTVTKYTVTPRKSELSELPSLHSFSLHDVLDLAMSSGIITCPVVIIGVEPKDVSLGEGLSAEVESSLPEAIEAVIKELGGSSMPKPC